MIAKNKDLNQLLVNVFIAFWLAVGFGIVDVHLAKGEKEVKEVKQEVKEPNLTPAPLPSLTGAGQALEVRNSSAKGELVKKTILMTILM